MIRRQQPLPFKTQLVLFNTTLPTWKCKVSALPCSPAGAMHACCCIPSAAVPPAVSVACSLCPPAVAAWCRTVSPLSLLVACAWWPSATCVPLLRLPPPCPAFVECCVPSLTVVLPRHPCIPSRGVWQHRITNEMDGQRCLVPEGGRRGKVTEGRWGGGVSQRTGLISRPATGCFASCVPPVVIRCGSARAAPHV